MAQRAPDVRHHLPFRDCIHLGNTRGNPSPYPPGLVPGGCVWDGIPALSSGVCKQCKGGWPTGPCIVNESWEPFSVGLGKGKFCSRNVFGEEGGQGGNESIVDDPKEVRRILMLIIIMMSIYVCDPEAAKTDAALPAKLNDSANLAKFVRNVLHGELSQMATEHAWSNIPRVVVHDKASYMVNSAGEQLNAVFGGALAEAGFRSWVGPQGASTKWMSSKWGDVYLHETAIAHIRRLLATRFVSTRVDETWAQFKARMQAVQDFMNSDEFAADDGEGLQGLAKELHTRCRDVIRLKGARIPKR